MTSLLLPAGRLPRWLENFGSRHGGTTLTVSEGALHGTADDGSTFVARLPFGREYAGPADLDAFAELCAPPASWGLLLVRRGGFAVARLAKDQVVDSKVGRRHVQGRTKAGGQSQQRFARRRDNQARVAFEAAADHAARVLAGVRQVVTGGDRPAVEAVLADPRLRHLVVVPPWLSVPDPRRGVLEQAARDAAAARVAVENA